MFQILPIDNITSRVISDDEEQFRALHSYFRIEDPKLKYTPLVRSGYSDGKRDIIKLDGTFYWGIKQKIISWCNARNIPIQDNVPSIAIKIDDNEWNTFVRACLLPYEPYDYQTIGAKHLLEQRRHIGLAATSAGKSLMLYLIIRWLVKEGLKIMLIVPDVGLVEQMFSDLKEYWESKEIEFRAKLNEAYTDEMKLEAEKWLNIVKLTREKHNFSSFEDTVCKIYAGHDKFTDHQVKITTWQSVYDLGPSGYFQDIDAILFDEVHKVQSNSYVEINQHCNASIKLGVSGTMNPSLLEQLILEGTIGPATTIITPKQLIDRGLATRTKIQPVFLQYPEDVVKEVKKMQWPEESKYFRLHEGKIDFVCKLAKKLTENGNGIILAKNVDTQKAYIAKMTSIHANTMAIIREIKPEEREAIRKSVDSYTDLSLIASAAIMTTGISIKSLTWAIQAQVNKAEIGTIQTLGRLLRLYQGKTESVIYDIVDDCRYYSKSGRAYPNTSFKHFEERLNAYAKYQYPVEKPIIIKMP